MEIGLVVDPRLGMPFTDALALALRHGADCIELGSGGPVSVNYFNPVELIGDDAALATFERQIAATGLRVVALGSYGNPLDPRADLQRAAIEHFDATCVVAERLGITRVVALSGQPGGPDDKTPNTIFPALLGVRTKQYEWQWVDQVLPYWRVAAEKAQARGLTVCIEPIPGQVVCDAPTFHRLKECGPFQVAFDTSHFWAMHADPLAVIPDFAGEIAHVHAKDVEVRYQEVARRGWLPPVPYDDWNNRSWVYRSLGEGHAEAWWSSFCTTLRKAGYDGPVLFEPEEPYLTPSEAVGRSLGLLRRVVPREPIPETLFSDRYDWGE